MSPTPKFSIIIPAWNAQKTLRRTLISVLQQTCDDYEVIVVNDGSTDGTAALLDEFSYQENIRVIHQQNAGVSAARNHALSQAEGEYIIFLDADDWVDDHFLASFQHSLESHCDKPVDLIVGNLVDERIGRISQYGYFAAQEMPGLLGELEISDNIGYLHNKCYSRRVMEANDLHFLEGISMSEDLLFNLKYFYNVSSCLVINSAAYHYENVMDSLSKKRVQYNELKERKQFLTGLYDTFMSKYTPRDLDYFLKGVSKRVLTLDMQIVTSMYHASFSPNEISREISEIKRGKYSKDILTLLNRNEKLKYIIMNFNSFAAYYCLYALYKARAF
ncbi:glycosyltransferase family 2 protein [Pantoea sp. KPR_PJ]|uniref:glycosyltransferase family 2 protein n=1 Tax=Pantoea sp. KPR_PJ TaxID=2738375 RepID=UPI003528034E